MAEFGEEVFDVGTWEAVEGFESEGGVFCYAGSADLGCLVRDGDGNLGRGRTSSAARLHFAIATS